MTAAVCYAPVSTLDRNVADQGASMAALSLLGIEVTPIDEPIAGGTAAGMYQRNMLGASAQYFRDDLSEKTKHRDASCGTSRALYLGKPYRLSQ